MNKEEAIKILNDYDINFERNTAEEIAEAHEMAIEALETQPNEDCISRKAAINALWKALHEYEDKTENQFSKSKELDVADWFQHRIFVQNMSDIDRQTILNLPSVTPQPKTEEQAFHVMKGKWITQWNAAHQKEYYYCSECREEFSYDGETGIKMNDYKYCPNCGAKMQEVKK